MTLFLLIIMAGFAYYIFIYKDRNKKFVNSTQKRCENCGNPVEPSFNVCPVCKETLKKKCSNCGEIIDTSWNYCPYCETQFKPVRKK